MGFNSVIIIRNDSLHVIAENGLTFTEKVVSAIRESGGHLREGNFVDIGIQGHVNAATLFHMALTYLTDRSDFIHKYLPKFA